MLVRKMPFVCSANTTRIFGIEMNEPSYKEVHNFFDDPDMIREFALLQNYTNFIWRNEGYWSGFRTHIESEEIKSELFNKLQNVLNKKIRNIVSCFHLNPQISMHGFPHVDSDALDSFAGVIYLNKEFPKDIDCGTTLYEDLPEHKNECGRYIKNFTDKLEIVYDVTINPDNFFKHQFSQECLNFKRNVLKKVKTFNFEYNKMICYPGFKLHSPDFYFGNGREISRLTIAFHGNFDAV